MCFNLSFFLYDEYLLLRCIWSWLTFSMVDTFTHPRCFFLFRFWSNMFCLWCFLVKNTFVIKFWCIKKKHKRCWITNHWIYRVGKSLFCILIKHNFRLKKWKNLQTQFLQWRRYAYFFFYEFKKLFSSKSTELSFF